MIDCAAGVPAANPDVSGFEGWQLFQHFLGSQAVPQQVENVNDTDGGAWSYWEKSEGRGAV